VFKRNSVCSFLVEGRKRGNKAADQNIPQLGFEKYEMMKTIYGSGKGKDSTENPSVRDN